MHVDLQAGLGNGRETAAELVIERFKLKNVAYAFSWLRHYSIIELGAPVEDGLDNLDTPGRCRQACP